VKANKNTISSRRALTSFSKLAYSRRSWTVTKIFHEQRMMRPTATIHPVTASTIHSKSAGGGQTPNARKSDYTSSTICLA